MTPVPVDGLFKRPKIGRLPSLPPATHEEEEVHEMTSTSEMPVGTESLVQVEPPFVVARMTPAAVSPVEVFATSASPTAMHELDDIQETLDKKRYPEGTLSLVQVEPPFVVVRMAPVFVLLSPTAIHEVAEVHDTPMMSETPEGTLSLVQVEPPFVVVRMAPVFVLPEVL